MNEYLLNFPISLPIVFVNCPAYHHGLYEVRACANYGHNLHKITNLFNAVNRIVPAYLVKMYMAPNVVISRTIGTFANGFFTRFQPNLFS